MRAHNNLGISAHAKTIPSSLFANIIGATYDGQSTESMSNTVFKYVRHFRHLENFTIDSGWQAVVKLLFGSYPSHFVSIAYQQTFRDLADTKNRVVATVDSSGNRTVVTRTLT